MQGKNMDAHTTLEWKQIHINENKFNDKCNGLITLVQDISHNGDYVHMTRNAYEQSIEMLVIGDAIALIMVSL